MSRLKTVTSEAIQITCKECGDPTPTTYKTTNLDTFKCIECGSRGIIKGAYTSITHDIPEGDLDEEDNN